ncbi:hypothetical protein MTO96_027266 [Rhipicephalus appendiculatus]
MRTAFPLGSTYFPPMKAWISAVIQRPTRDTNHRAPAVWANVQRPGAINQDTSTSDKHTDGYNTASIVVALSCARSEYTFLLLLSGRLAFVLRPTLRESVALVLLVCLTPHFVCTGGASVAVVLRGSPPFATLSLAIAEGPTGRSTRKEKEWKRGGSVPGRRCSSGRCRSRCAFLLGVPTG